MIEVTQEEEEEAGESEIVIRADRRMQQSEERWSWLVVDEPSRDTIHRHDSTRDCSMVDSHRRVLD